MSWYIVPYRYIFIQITTILHARKETADFANTQHFGLKTNTPLFLPPAKIQYLFHMHPFCLL
jgi:hypothetical protein